MAAERPYSGENAACRRRYGFVGGSVVVVFLLRVPQGVIAAVTIDEEIHDALEGGVERAGTGVIALVAKAVNVASDVGAGFLPIAGAHDATEGEVPGLTGAHLRFRAARGVGAMRTGFRRA